MSLPGKVRRFLAFGGGHPVPPILLKDRVRPTWKETSILPPLRLRTLSGEHPHYVSRLIPPQPVNFPVPASLETGDPAGFGSEERVRSDEATVHWIPGAIYHGWHGAVAGANGSYYAEGLDCDRSQIVKAPAKQSIRYLEGRSAALSCTKNHFHWLIKMLPRLGLLEKVDPGFRHFDSFLVNKPAAYQGEIYALLGISDKCVEVPESQALICQQLAVPSLAHDAAAWACHYVREKIAPMLLGPTRKKPERLVFLRRLKASQRRVHNEEEAYETLRPLGFEAPDVSKLSLREQAQLCSESRMIVAAHGAALANIAFCQPGATLLEIFGTPLNQKVYWRMSNHLGLRYSYMMGMPAGEETADPNMRDMEIPCDKLLRAVKQLL